MTTEVEVEAEERTVEEEEAVQVAAAAEAADDDGAPPAALDETDAQADLEPPAEALGPEALARVVESLLLASPVPLTLDAAREATGASAAELRDAFAAIAGRLREGASGMVVVEVADAWQLRTSAESAAAVRRLLRIRPQRLTRAALETLALVAYRQPITRADVEDVRGVDCGAVLKALLERRLVKILGKKEELGRPLLYGTTREFLEFFGLKGLDQLPTLREFQELSEEHRSIVEKEAPAPLPGIAGIAELADQALSRRLSETAGEDEAALADLEAAMEEADARAKLVGQTLDPQPAEAEPAAPPVP